MIKYEMSHFLKQSFLFFSSGIWIYREANEVAGIPFKKFYIAGFFWEDQILKNLDYLENCLATEKESDQLTVIASRTKRVQVYQNEYNKQWVLGMRCFKLDDPDRMMITYSILLNKNEAAEFFKYAHAISKGMSEVKDKKSAEKSAEKGNLKRTAEGYDIAPPLKYKRVRFFWKGFGGMDAGDDFPVAKGDDSFELPKYLQLTPAQLKEAREKETYLLFIWKSNDSKHSYPYWYLKDCKMAAMKHASQRDYSEMENRHGQAIVYELDVTEMEKAKDDLDPSLEVEHAAMYVMYRTICSKHECGDLTCSSIHGTHPNGVSQMWNIEAKVLTDALTDQFCSIWNSPKYKENVLFALGAINLRFRRYDALELKANVHKFFLFMGGEMMLSKMYNYFKIDPESVFFTHNVRSAIEKALEYGQETTVV